MLPPAAEAEAAGAASEGLLLVSPEVVEGSEGGGCAGASAHGDSPRGSILG